MGAIAIMCILWETRSRPMGSYRPCDEERSDRVGEYGAGLLDLR